MIALGCLLGSLVLCEALRRWALGRALVDAPTHRGLHSVPVPRLGGVAIVVAVLACMAVSWSERAREVRMLALVGLGVAVLGVLDDVRPLRAAIRFPLHIAVGVVMLKLAGVPPLVVARGLAIGAPSLAVGAVLVVWIAGSLNIYNFMDGMDGLAGCQGAIAAAALATVLGPPYGTYATLVAVACVGFLAHNYPPARIFMGDGGSTFLGTTFAVLAVLGMHQGVPITESALPLSPFLLDGTFTIARRVKNGERIWEAHRSHLYQRLVLAGVAPREVLLAYVVWMLVASLGSLAAQDGNVALGCAWAATLLALFVVWRWTLARESQKASAA